MYAENSESFARMYKPRSTFPPRPSRRTKSLGAPERDGLISWVSQCFALLLLVTTGGCVYFPDTVRTYNGSALPQAQIATVSSYAPDYIVVAAVDGRPIPDAGPTLKRVEIEVLPGQHVIDCRYYPRHQRTESPSELLEKIKRGLVLQANLVDYDVLPPKKMNLNAIAGHNYRVESSGDSFLLRDLSTGVAQ